DPMAQRPPSRGPPLPAAPAERQAGAGQPGIDRPMATGASSREHEPSFGRWGGNERLRPALFAKWPGLVRYVATEAITSATASGCDRNGEWLASISTTSEQRAAYQRCDCGWIA